MQEKKLIIRLLFFLKPHKRKIASAIFCMIAGSGLTSMQAYMVKPLLDEIFVNKDRGMLNIIPFALIMLFLLKGVFNYFSNSLLDTLGQTIIRDLRKNIFSHIHSLPISFFHNTPTGELIARVINDSALVQQAVSRALAGVFKDLFQVFGLVCVVVYLNWKLAIIGLVFLPLAFLPVAHFGRKFRKLSTTNQQTVAQISNILHETITGHKIIKAFSMEKYETKRFSETVDKLFSVIVKDIKNNSLQGPIMELLGGIGITAIIWYGGHQVINGHSTPGIFFAFLTSIIMIYNPIKGVSNINSAIQQGLAATTRIFALLDTQSSIHDQAGAVPLPPFQKTIKFNDLSFSYDGKAEALKNINLTVKAGEVIALVGTSGGGKTTLVNLIPRFFDATSGSITIDDHDLREVTMGSLRNQIAMVSQQTILFNDTIRNNIAYGDPNRSMDEIIATAKAAHALDFINEMPEGFDTVIGESGARLSGGQQQRISIARALLKNAPILILDEATSALDTESEREVQTALENLMKNRTTFVIAHRLSTIKNADRIIVMQAGRIVEEGTNEQLLDRQGLYSTLHCLQ
ncbi:MAG: lipid A export permease/ATP-binding protein MsbA [Deltaproteobacteria bacterium RIFOXYD12_FULL_55_16]|nr:MAG: lipid A export permease/ATP-binding protein MsbA [Deltaproteobacteria bacterium RIFOXYD12_FULL_55_16]